MSFRYACVAHVALNMLLLPTTKTRMKLSLSLYLPLFKAVYYPSLAFLSFFLSLQSLLVLL